MHLMDSRAVMPEFPVPLSLTYSRWTSLSHRHSLEHAESNGNRVVSEQYF